MPTREATPALDQPLVEKVVSTDESLLGAITLAVQESAYLPLVLRSYGFRVQCVPEDDNECEKPEDMSDHNNALYKG